MRAIILGTFIMNDSGFILFIIHFHAYNSINLIISSGKCFIMRKKISKSSLKNLATFTFKGTFHAKMGTIKDRNGMDITKAQDIKKRWQKYTEELYEREPTDPDNHDGVITHLEPDILECCEVRWALGSITTNKARGGDGISVELSNPER